LESVLARKCSDTGHLLAYYVARFAKLQLAMFGKLSWQATGKSRLVPLHASTCRVLANYLARRKRHWAKRPVSSYVFVSNWGNQLDVGEIHRTFYTLSRHVGLRGPTDSHGPRLHDLRHRFALMTLLHWYRTGEDAERRLPILSTYLGHVHISDTFWYLSAWPELMHEAMARLERCWEARP